MTKYVTWTKEMEDVVIAEVKKYGGSEGRLPRGFTDQLAERLGVSIGPVRSKVHKIRQQLREEEAKKNQDETEELTLTEQLHSLGIRLKQNQRELQDIADGFTKLFEEIASLESYLAETVRMKKRLAGVTVDQTTGLVEDLKFR